MAAGDDDAAGRLARAAAVFGLVAAFLSSPGQTFFIGLSGGALQAELGLGEDALGAYYAAATLASGLLMFWLGEMADRLAPARAIAVSLLVLAAGALLLALSHGPALLLGALFLLRLGGQGLTGHLALVAAARHGGARRGRVLAVASTGFIVGEALLPLALVAALGSIDWRHVWVGVAALLLVAIVPVRRTAAPLPAAPLPSSDPADGPRLHRWRLLVDPRFAAAVAVTLVPAAVATAVFLHQASLATLRGWTPASVGSAFAAFALIQAGAMWLSGRLVDRVGAVRLLPVFLMPLAAGALAAGFLHGQAALWLLFAGLGVTVGASRVVVGAAWAELFGTAQLGLVRGVFTALMVIATAVAPAALGLALAADVSLQAVATGTAAYAVAVPLLLASGLRRGVSPPAPARETRGGRR